MFPTWIKAIEKRIEANGGKYIAGDKITIADFALSYVCFGLLLNEANAHVLGWQWVGGARHHSKGHNT